MNANQHASYTAIKEGYKTHPRWIAEQEVMNDPLLEGVDREWAQEWCAEFERSCAKSAEQARIAGL